MTLAQAHPYWIVGDVPVEDIPYIACNDMLEGNLDDEIVALAALSGRDPREVADLAPRALARLGLQPMTEQEAARVIAVDRMQDVARRIVSRELDPLLGAWAIYKRASEAGLFGDGEGVDPAVAEYGTEFLQLGDALDARQGNGHQARQFEELIVEAAEALLAGEPTPAWHSDGAGNLHRGNPVDLGPLA